MILPNNILVIYHETKPGTPCTDGIAGAWVINEAAKRHKLGCVFGLENNVPLSLRFCGRCYGEPLPEDAVRWANNIVIVDFSFSALELERLVSQGKKLLVIDHHKSAAGKLEGVGNLANCELLLDLSSSGALLAWRRFFSYPDVPPGFILYISDRDLWQFKLPESKAVNAEIGFGGRTFERFDELAKLCDVDLQAALGPKGLVRQIKLNETCSRIAGSARIESVGVQDIPIVRDIARWAATNHVVWLRDFVSWLAGYRVPVARLTADGSEDWARSEVGNLLASCALVKDFGLSSLPFAACRFADGGMSLRSKDELMDVSKVCERMGGGGHRNAAGYGGQSLEKQRAAVVVKNGGRSWWACD